MNRRLTGLALAAIILAAALIRIRLIDIPLERDEGEYALSGQLMLHGIPPYQQAWNMKFPGTYAAYALIMAIAGQTTRAIHDGLLVVNSLTILLVYLLARRFFRTPAALAACATFAFLSLGSGVFGLAAHATHFVILFALAGTLLLLRGNVLLSGLLFGIAILMKQPGAFFALFGATWLLRSTTFRRTLTFILAAALPVLLTCLTLWKLGVFERFWFWTFRYASQYAREDSISTGWFNLTSALSRILWPNAALWTLAVLGLIVCWLKSDQAKSALPLTLFLLCSTLAVCPGLYFRPHYFILMLPAIALLAGAAVEYGPPKAALIVWAAALALSVFQQREFLFRMAPLEASRFLYELNPFPEAVKVAQYLRAHTKAGTPIAILGSEPEILFYADRPPASGYIYMYGLMEPQPFAREMQNDLIRQLEQAKPEYVVLVSIEASWLPREDSSLHIFEWWREYGRAHYTRTGIVDLISPEITNYWWDAEAAQHPVPPLTYIVIERRNPEPPPTRP